MMLIKVLLQAMRLPFLVLTPVCIYLGFGLASTSHPEINFNTLVIVLIGAIAAHTSVNTLNEYHDFKSGLDLITEKTAFSGGSGALPNYPDAARSVLVVGLASLTVTIVIGIKFILDYGLHIMPIGLVGVMLIVAYTQWINRFPCLCLIAPGLGFGVLMVVGTYIVLSGGVSSSVCLISLVPFLLANNLLLLNQYPDIKADASVGRNTFPIAYGINNSNIVYAFFMITAYLLVMFFIYRGAVPKLGVIALVPMLFSSYSLIGAIKYKSKIGKHPKYMAANVVAAVFTPLLLGIAVIYG